MMKLFIATMFLIVGATAHAEKDFSSWRKFSTGTLVGETTALTPDSVGTIGFHVTLAEHWHTYWVNPGDSGVPLRISFKNSPGVRVKQVLHPRPERFLTGPLISFGFSKQALFLIELEVGKDVKIGDTATIEADLEWLVCEDVCIPAIDTLKLEMPVKALADVQPGPNFALFQEARAAVAMTPQDYPKWEDAGDRVTLTVTDWRDREFVDFFPFRNSGVTNEKPEVLSTSPLKLAFKKSNVPREIESRVGLLVSRNTRTGKIESTQFGDSGWKFSGESGAKEGQSLWWMLISAFIGGLILNLMPCVFPILSMKLLSLLKLGGGHAKEVRQQNLAYVAGVLVSFLAIALLLAGLRSAGHLIGWGFQLQSPVFLVLLCWLFFLLSLNLLGVFEIDFLNAGMGSKLTRISGWWGSFFTGVLAVVVASPCTAPFMGVALGFGLTQSVPLLIAIFLMLGLGLAFPYLIVAIVPSTVRLLPRPGRWMNTVKQIMAVPLLLTTAWLVWILAQVQDDVAVAIVIAGCVTMALMFLVPKPLRIVARILTALLVVAGLGYTLTAAQGVRVSKNADEWAPYSEAALEKAKGQPLFINMTADWCLTCKVNERLVFDDPDVMALFKQKKIILMKGDWTQRNEEITRFLARYDRVGVPFYVLYSPQHPEGQTLPEVLTKSSFMELIQKEFP